MADIRIISQRTGEFISEDAGEPGFVVNMSDEGAQAFIDRVKADNGIKPAIPAAAAPVVAAPASVVESVATPPVDEPDVPPVDESTPITTRSTPAAPPRAAKATPKRARKRK